MKEEIKNLETFVEYIILQTKIQIFQKLNEID